MPDFTKYSNFDPDASYGTIKYAADALMLEVELNEAQKHPRQQNSHTY